MQYNNEKDQSVFHLLLMADGKSTMIHCTSAARFFNMQINVNIDGFNKNNRNYNHFRLCQKLHKF